MSDLSISIDQLLRELQQGKETVPRSVQEALQKSDLDGNNSITYQEASQYVEYVSGLSGINAEAHFVARYFSERFHIDSLSQRGFAASFHYAPYRQIPETLNYEQDRGVHDGLNTGDVGNGYSWDASLLFLFRDTKKNLIGRADFSGGLGLFVSHHEPKNELKGVIYVPDDNPQGKGFYITQVGERDPLTYLGPAAGLEVFAGVSPFGFMGVPIYAGLKGEGQARLGVNTHIDKKVLLPELYGALDFVFRVKIDMGTAGDTFLDFGNGLVRAWLNPIDSHVNTEFGAMFSVTYNTK